MSVTKFSATPPQTYEAPDHQAPMEAALAAQDLVALNGVLDRPDMNEEVIRSYLRDAVRTDSLAVVQSLLSRLPCKPRPSSALNHPASQGNLAMVELLLPYCSPKSDNSNALRYAAAKGHGALVERLLPLSNPKAVDSDALRLAALCGHLAIVQRLVPVSDVSAKHDAPLRNAASRGHHEVARFLWPLSSVAQTIPYLIQKHQWKELDALAPVLPPSEQAVLKDWLDQAPAGALPKTLARQQALTRVQAAQPLAPTQERRVNRARS